MARSLNAKLGAGLGRPGRRRAPAGARQGNPWGVIMAFLAPALALYLLLTAYPILKTFYNSFHLIQPNQPDQFVGLANYVELLTDGPDLRQGAGQHADLGDGGAGRRRHARPAARRLPLRPDPGLALLPRRLVQPGADLLRRGRRDLDVDLQLRLGRANGLLRWLGLGDFAHVWLGDPRTALWAVILVDAWKWVGFHMVVCLAALHSLPREVMEAAELDNCGFWKKLFFVAIPMIRTTLVGLLDPRLHRQDEGLRSGLDHDQGRPAVEHRDARHLHLQAGVRMADLRSRLSLGDRGGLVPAGDHHRARARPG